MRTSVLNAVFASVLGLAAFSCGDVANEEEGSWSESALKKLADGGSCRCAKEEKGKADAGRGQDDEEKGKPDGGRGKSDEAHGKSEQDHGKPDAGKGSDEDEASDEDELEVEALKRTPDAGAKRKKLRGQLADCSC